MATSRKKRVRFTLDLNFTSDAEKDAFCGRLSAVRDQITPSGSHTLNNRELLSALFDPLCFINVVKILYYKLTRYEIMV